MRPVLLALALTLGACDGEEAEVVRGHVGIPQAEDVALYAGFAYVAAHESGLTIVDVLDPTAPSVTATYDTMGRARQLVATRSTLYLADTAEGLRIFDLSVVPGEPPEQVGWNPGWQVHAMAADGSLGVVVGGDGTSGWVVALDLTDALVPVVLGSAEITGDEPNGTTVAIEGSTAWVGREQGAIHTFDLTDPSTPVLADTWDEYAGTGASRGLSMAVDGDRLYYANGGEGLHILDISTPLAPTHLSRDLEANTTARDVAASGTTAVLAFDKGLRLFEVSDPANPVHLRDVSCIIDALDDDPHGLEVAGDLAYVADNRQEALVVVDISRQDVR